MKVRVETLKQARDERGTVFEPLDAGGLAQQRNVHVVLTHPGCVRGNHYHRQTTEVLTVYGPALVRIQDEEMSRDFPVPEHEVLRFTIPPGISHAILNTGRQLGLLVSFTSKPHDPEHPDVVRNALIEPQAR